MKHMYSIHCILILACISISSCSQKNDSIQPEGKTAPAKETSAKEDSTVQEELIRTTDISEIYQNNLDKAIVNYQVVTCDTSQKMEDGLNLLILKQLEDFKSVISTNEMSLISKVDSPNLDFRSIQLEHTNDSIGLEIISSEIAYITPHFVSIRVGWAMHSTEGGYSDLHSSEGGMFRLTDFKKIAFHELFKPGGVDRLTQSLEFEGWDEKDIEVTTQIDFKKSPPPTFYITAEATKGAILYINFPAESTLYDLEGREHYLSIVESQSFSIPLSEIKELLHEKFLIAA